MIGIKLSILQVFLILLTRYNCNKEYRRVRMWYAFYMPKIMSEIYKKYVEITKETYKYAEECLLKNSENSPILPDKSFELLVLEETGSLVRHETDVRSSSS